MKRIFLLTAALFIIGLTGCGNNTYSYSPQNVDQEIKDAKEFFEKEKYSDSLKLYLEAMSLEPKSEEARLGVIRCQIALENYNMALTNLSALMDLNPMIVEIYDLYLQIAQETDNIGLAINTVTLADTYKIEEIIEKIPQEPVISVESGTYKNAINVEITTEEPDAEIYYIMSCDLLNYNFSYLYTGSLSLLGGKIKISAYTVKDDIPSLMVDVNYEIDGPKQEVTFTDPVIEALVRNTLDKQEGIITDLDCWQIQYLNTSNLKIDDMDNNEYQTLKLHTLEDLKLMPNLYNLILQSTQDELVDYDAISNCRGLLYLYVYGGNLSDISFVEQLPNLKEFTAYDNDINDITPLLNCKSIQHINLKGNPVTGLDSLFEQLPLASAIINDHQLENYEVLKECKKLTSLNIIGLEGVDYEAIGKLTALNSLVLQQDWNEIQDSNKSVIENLSFVSDLKDLTYLYLQGVEDASQLVYLHGLQNLQTLYLYSCGATEDETAMEQLAETLPNCNIGY